MAEYWLQRESGLVYVVVRYKRKTTSHILRSVKFPIMPLGGLIKITRAEVEMQRQRLKGGKPSVVVTSQPTFGILQTDDGEVAVVKPNGEVKWMRGNA